jgi:hypothetical protein
MARPLRGALAGVDIGRADPVRDTFPVSSTGGTTWRYVIRASAVRWTHHDGRGLGDAVFDSALAREPMDFWCIRRRLAALKIFLGLAS